MFHFAGITRKELARTLCMGTETIQEIENTNCVPKPKVVRRLLPFIEQQFAMLNNFEFNPKPPVPQKESK